MFRIGIFSTIVVLCSFGTRIFGQQDCVVPITSTESWKTFWPLVFHENGSLYDTLESGDVLISKGNSVLISCGPNYVKKYSPKKFVNAKCEDNGQFRMENDISLKPAEDLGCDLRSIEEVLVSVDGCPQDNTAVKFGFLNPVDSFSYVTGEACYNVPKGRIVFAHVALGNFENSILEVKNRNFFNNYQHPESRYKSDFMKAFLLDEFNDRLRASLGVETVPQFRMNNYIDTDLLSSKQLITTKKFAWNYFVHHDDLTNFDLLKKDIGNLEKTIDIYTGSSGVLNLKAANGNDVKIYLNNTVNHERFPVPDFIWTIVKSGQRATGFVIFNNPKLTEAELNEKSFCASKCNKIKWLGNLGKDENYLNRRRGAVICCEYQEFKENSKVEAPVLNGITGLLE